MGQVMTTRRVIDAELPGRRSWTIPYLYLATGLLVIGAFVVFIWIIVSRANAERKAREVADAVTELRLGVRETCPRTPTFRRRIIL
jgi:hypothetical protein